MVKIYLFNFTFFLKIQKIKRSRKILKYPEASGPSESKISIFHREIWKDNGKNGLKNLLSICSKEKTQHFTVLGLYDIKNLKRVQVDKTKLNNLYLRRKLPNIRLHVLQNFHQVLHLQLYGRKSVIRTFFDGFR